MSILKNILEKSSNDELVTSLSAVYESNPLKWEAVFNQVKYHAASLKYEQIEINEQTCIPLSVILCEEINKLRQNPHCYIKHLDAHVEKFKDEYIYINNNGKIILTKDGKNGVYNAKLFLDSCKSCDVLLSVSQELETKVKFDSISFYNSPLNNYINNLSLQQRLSDHKNKRGVIIKFTQFGIQDVIDVIVSLLIDDGIATKCHRDFLLSSDLKFIGAVYNSHSMYDHMISVAMSTINIVETPTFMYAVSISNIDQFDNQVRLNIRSIPEKGEEIEMLIVNALKDGCVVHYEYNINTVKLTTVKELIDGKQVKQIEFNI